MAGPEPLLDLERFAKRFENGKGFGPVDLRLEPGVHGVLGPNGSGKTTFLKTLLGFHAPTGGRGRVLGRDVAAEPLAVRRLVGYMPENDVFVPGLNAAQTVRLAAELCGIGPARAHEAASEALQAVGLGEEALHDPARLSTGQRQKMKLAAALVHAPRLLVLDEPTNGLDAVARRTMLDLVAEVSRDKGISVLLSTHILPDVEAVCDDAVLLRDGLLAGRETVAARQTLREGQRTWFRVEVLGDPASFVAACKARGVPVRQARAGLRVAAANVSALLAIARSAKALLATATPATAGVEEAVLERLEGKEATEARPAAARPARSGRPARRGAAA